MMRHLVRVVYPVAIWLCLLSFQAHTQELNFSAYRYSPLQGLSSVILDEAYRYLNIPIKVTPYTIQNDRNSDGEVSQVIGLEKERTDLIRITESVNYIEETVFTKNLEINIENWNSLSPHIIGIALGAKHSELKTKHMQRIMAPSYRQLFAMLDQNKLELIVSPLIEGLFTMRQTRLTHLKPLSQALVKVELYHYLHKKHATLAPRIEQAIKIMKENGRIESLRQKFIQRLKQT